jgi:hypothetical protein
MWDQHPLERWTPVQLPSSPRDGPFCRLEVHPLSIRVSSGKLAHANGMAPYLAFPQLQCSPNHHRGLAG